MSKTIVNIIDKSNPMPAYLFTKEYYEEGDTLLLRNTMKKATRCCLSPPKKNPTAYNYWPSNWKSTKRW